MQDLGDGEEIFRLQDGESFGKPPSKIEGDLSGRVDGGNELKKSLGLESGLTRSFVLS